MTTHERRGLTTTLVDSNVLVDVIAQNSPWTDWSTAALRRVGGESIAVINPIIYAELAAGFDSIEELELAIPVDLYGREQIPYEAAFLAGKVFVEYRRRGGNRRSPLPDFYVGAHAIVSGFRLLTRDASRFRTYFPSLEIISPG